MTEPFGRRLRQLRRKHGWTLKDLAERSGLSISHISSLERGVRSRPSVEAAHRLAKVLDVSIEFFLDEDSITESKVSVPSRPPGKISRARSVLEHLPADIRTFILNENSAPYLSFAKRISESSLTEPEMMAALLELIRELQQSESKGIDGHTK